MHNSPANQDASAHVQQLKKQLFENGRKNGTGRKSELFDTYPTTPKSLRESIPAGFFYVWKEKNLSDIQNWKRKRPSVAVFMQPSVLFGRLPA